MNRLSIGLIGAGLLVLAGCKERLAPHVTPEADPEVLVADAIAADTAARAASQGHTAQSKKITLTVNNAPGPEQTVEHEVLQQMVELFEKRHPNIKIQFSPWRYTPESFFERASSRALTDIVEVDYSQIPPILDLNYAADLTDLVGAAPQLADVNPELIGHLTRNGRLYGIPGEMHTMALFYNRRLVDAVLNPPKPKAADKKSDKAGKDAGSKPTDDETTKTTDTESAESTETGETSSDDPEGAATSRKKENESSEGDRSSRRRRSSEGERRRNPDTNSGEESGREERRRSTDTDRRRSNGADGEPREFLTDEPVFDTRPESIMSRYTIPAELLDKSVAAELNAPRMLAQYQYQYPPQQGGVYYADPQSQQQQQQQPRRSRRAPQQQDYYGQPQQSYYQQQPQPQPQQQERRGFFGWFGGQQGPTPEEMPPPPGPRYRGAPGQYDPFDPASPGYRQPNMDGMYNMEPTPAPRSRRRQASTDSESTSSKRVSAIDEDVLSTDPVSLTTETAKLEEKVTTVVETAGLPQDWDSFIRLATKLTDHGTTPTYGYAPILFAKEGGREFAQWSIQAGLQIQIATGATATLDVNTTSAAMVAQFLKDLHWRYDVTPPPAQCYADNLMKLFAEGRIGMMMLPADRETITRLIRLGLPVDDLGIAPLPGGPANRNHLGFGRCYIVNSQLDSERRAAALQWLLFQLDPEVIKLRKTAAFREQDWTGVPEVPIFKLDKYQTLVDSLRPYYTLPIYPEYYRTVASGVALEPPYFTGRLYEALAEGVRAIVENRASDPMQAIAYVGADFEKKYLKNAPTPEGIRRYLQMIPGL